MPEPFHPRVKDVPTLVRPVPIDLAGVCGPTRGQAAGPRWRRVGKNAYVPAFVIAEIPEQRVMEASVRLPAGAAVTGWAALRMAGAAYFDGRDASGRPLPVSVLVAGRGQPRAGRGMVVSREPMEGVQVRLRWGIPIVEPVRALFDEMRRASNWREVVVAMDLAAAAELVSISELGTFLDVHSSWRRARRVRRALTYASERSRSPAETRMRLIWEVDAALPRPLVNEPVFDLNEQLLGVADLFDPVAGVVGEYDGAEHRAARRHARDVHREEMFRRVRLEYFKVTGPDMHTPNRVVDRMISTRTRARFEPPTTRLWTLEPPQGWPVEESLDDRRAHDAWLAEQLRRERGM